VTLQSSAPHPIRRLARLALIGFGVSPVLLPLIADVVLLAPFARVLGAWFELQCHREPDRTGAWLGASLPVCHRCLGIYLGLAVGAALLRPQLAGPRLLFAVGAAAALMIADVATEAVGLRPASAVLRVVTGCALALPVGAAAARALLARATSEAHHVPE
jgi:uncharacterized membrane protein